MTKQKPKAVRQRIVKIRLSDDEYQALQTASTRVELARWMRETCLNPEHVKPRKTVAAADPVLLRQLAAIGNNLNQIARRVNSGEWGALDTVRITAALAAVERQLKGVKDDC